MNKLWTEYEDKYNGMSIADLELIQAGAKASRETLNVMRIPFMLMTLSSTILLFSILSLFDSSFLKYCGIAIMAIVNPLLWRAQMRKMKHSVTQCNVIQHLIFDKANKNDKSIRIK